MESMTQRPRYRPIIDSKIGNFYHQQCRSTKQYTGCIKQVCYDSKWNYFQGSQWITRHGTIFTVHTRYYFQGSHGITEHYFQGSHCMTGHYFQSSHQVLLSGFTLHHWALLPKFTLGTTFRVHTGSLSTTSKVHTRYYFQGSHRITEHYFQGSHQTLLSEFILGHWLPLSMFILGTTFKVCIGYWALHYFPDSYQVSGQHFQGSH